MQRDTGIYSIMTSLRMYFPEHVFNVNLVHFTVCYIITSYEDVLVALYIINNTQPQYKTQDKRNNDAICSVLYLIVTNLLLSKEYITNL